jgi:hypothetical protein
MSKYQKHQENILLLVFCICSSFSVFPPFVFRLGRIRLWRTYFAENPILQDRALSFHCKAAENCRIPKVCFAPCTRPQAVICGFFSCSVFNVRCWMFDVHSFSSLPQAVVFCVLCVPRRSFHTKPGGSVAILSHPFLWPSFCLLLLLTSGRRFLFNLRLEPRHSP